MQEKIIVRFLKTMAPTCLLSFHIMSYGIAAYIPQTLRECITAVYEGSGSNNHKEALKELYAVIKENRMLASDQIVRKGVKEGLEVIGTLHKISSAQQNMVEYLEQYLKTLNDKAILLTMKGDIPCIRSWSVGFIERCMQQEKEAYDFLRLSNELSNNLFFCGSETDAVLLDSRAMNNMWNNQKRSSNNPLVTFNPNNMTNSQSLNPTIIFGSTGVGSSVINGWMLTPGYPQSPINMQFVIPNDCNGKGPVSLEIGLLVPNNGLSNGYVNFQIQEKYLVSSHSFNPNDVNWTHVDTSGNVKIDEASNPDNVKYMMIEIPLDSSRVKPDYFALLSISRISPTDSKNEYAGDLALVSAVFKYTS